MMNFIDAAQLLGWRTMHISDSRKMVNRDGQLQMVGDIECKGWPDIVACHRPTGRMIAVEVKKELEQLTPEQEEWLEDLAACGADTFVLRPSLWDAGVALLRRPIAA